MILRVRGSIVLIIGAWACAFAAYIAFGNYPALASFGAGVMVAIACQKLAQRENELEEKETT